MKTTQTKAYVLVTLFALLLLTPPLAAADTELATEVTLLVGRPTDGSEGDLEVLIVPGSVIAVQAAPHLHTTPSAGGGAEAIHQELDRTHQRIGQVADDLVKSLRLGVVEVRYWKPLSLAIGEPYDLPAPSNTSNVRLTIKLLGFNDAMASYEVQFFDGTMPLTNTPLTVHRGKQAVVGGLDGPDAPYLFLMIAPAGAESTALGVPAGPVRVDGNIHPPQAVEKTPPAYTQEARDAKVQGVVIVQAIIDRDGTVSELKVLKGLPYGLSEAAAEAISQWRFKPALMDGKPIAVYYNLTVNFRLPAEKKEP